MSEQSLRVLLVDDEQELTEYLAKRLRREGFEVTTTNSGEEAIEVVQQYEIDVAIVDLKMPGLNGIQTQQKLKELRPFLQTIVLTGHASVETALESGQQDAYKYLEKPADHNLLIATIREAGAKISETRQTLFQDELDQILTSMTSPREIMKATEELRKKYGLV